MDEYDQAAQLASKVVTQTYSTSFSSAIRLFSKPLRPHIYNIYGLVRITDEIVDTYQQTDAGQLLDDLEDEVYAALKRGFSTNVTVQAFCLTANSFSIDKSLIKPFFASMRMDLHKKTFTAAQYKTYIHGSAEVIGLMCLKVFVDGDQAQYTSLKNGAAALGSAFQKVNFLRDLADDHVTRGRYYFPIGSFETFDDKTKTKIINDIRADFKRAEPAVAKLPSEARPATRLAYTYYSRLLHKLEQAPASTITQKRVRLNRATKVWLVTRVKLGLYDT